MPNSPATSNPHRSELEAYIDEITHDWLRILTTLGFTLVPMFFFLDMVIIPNSSRHLLPLFGVYRVFGTALAVVQFLILRRTRPSSLSFLHGYLFNVSISLVIVLMTVKLGGFKAPYYAGLNLVIIAVNMLLPWKAMHSALNGLLTLGLYVGINALFTSDYDLNSIINNVYFIFSTVVIATAISHVKHQLICKEFAGRQELKQARDALWGEMEIAKRIQTALLPLDADFAGYEVGATMLPADEVGGDYYDIVELANRKWIIIGDVSGHGVESGLVMMMTQTSVRSTLNAEPNAGPSRLLAQVNTVIKDNIERLGAERYMTISALCLDGASVTVSGKHQDILIYRAGPKETEVVPTEGTWLGIVDNMGEYLNDKRVEIAAGDVILLFTDGITEAENKTGEMFGDERLRTALNRYAHLSVKEIVSNILRDVTVFAEKPSDDLTLVVVRRI